MNLEEQSRYARWARVELGMPRSEFNTYTLSEFVDIVSLWRKRENRKEVQLGRLCYVVASSAGSTTADNKPIPLDYFMPDYVPPKKKEKKVPLLEQFLNAIAGAQIIDNRKPHGKK